MKTTLLGDIVGGVAPITGSGQDFVTIEGRLVILNTGSDLVTPHHLGNHASPGNHMVGAIQTYVRINGNPVMIDGDKAECLDVVVATGFVNIN